MCSEGVEKGGEEERGGWGREGGGGEGEEGEGGGRRKRVRWEENSHGRKDTVFSPETGRGKVDGSLLGRSRENFNYLVWLY